MQNDLVFVANENQFKAFFFVYSDRVTPIRV